MLKLAVTVSPSLRAFLATAFFAAILFLILPYHEVWRDEMHDLSMVMSWKSLPDLLKNTTSHGFPALWYLVLWTGYHLTHSVLVLKMASLAAVTAGAYLFIRHAPFSRLEKTLFLAGQFPLYHYSIISRSYSLSFLLLFAACASYPKRFQNIFLLAAALFLLANTGAHSLLLACALFVCLAVQYFSARRRIQNPTQWLAAFGFIIFGIALAVVQIWPDPESTVKYHVITPPLIAAALEKSLFTPGDFFSQLFGLYPGVVTVSLWLITLASFRRQFSTGLFIFLSGFSLALLFQLIYPGALRHQGFLYLALIALFWLERSDDAATPRGPEKNWFFDFTRRYREAFLVITLVIQVIAGYETVKWDLFWPYSSSGDFAAYLRRDPRLREAVLVPEPDYLAEPLPFYTNNPIYFTRESRFGTFIHFTTANAAELSLDELLDTAHEVREKTGKPVLLMIGHVLPVQGPYEIFFSYGKTFRYSPKELKRLETETVLLTQFRSAMIDENYDIHLLKEKAAPA